MIASLEGWPTEAKKATSPHEVKLTLLDNNPVFQYLGNKYEISITILVFILDYFQEKLF